MTTVIKIGTSISSQQGGSSRQIPLSLVVEDAEPTHIVITFNKALTTDVFTDYTSSIGSSLSVTRDVTNTIHTLVIDTAYNFGDTGTINYKGKSYPVTNNVGWSPLGIDSKMLFWGKVSEISGGHMPNKVTGSSDYLTVTGSPATYQCPNTQPYLDADTEYLWKSFELTLRTVTTAELIGFDTQRTIVKYDNDTPYTLREIIILKAGETLTSDEIDKLHIYMSLSVFWSGIYNANGFVKGNRAVQSVWIPDNPATIMDTSKTAGWYKPLVAGGSGYGRAKDLIWWDLTIGSATLGAEQTSGVILIFAVYKIVKTQTNFFYTGCAVGDTFVCDTVKTCDANNTVQRYTGNHLTQHTLSKHPALGVCDGVTQYIRTALITLNRPVFTWILGKQITWTLNDYFCDGAAVAGDTMNVYQSATTPAFKLAAGSSLGENTNLPLNTWGIIRILSNGASSKTQVEETTAVTGNAGAAQPSGFTFGARVNGAQCGNVAATEILVRKVSESAEDEATLLRYYKYKKSLL